MLENKAPIVYFGPQPGAKRFLHYLVIIIVLILFVVFLQRISDVEKVVEKTAIEKKFNEFNSVLLVMTMEHVVNNKQHELINYHHSNPFELIKTRSTIINYFGEVEGVAGLEKKGGWYFDRNTKDVLYHSTQGEVTRFKLVYSLANNKKSNELGLLVLEKKPRT